MKFHLHIVQGIVAAAIGFSPSAWADAFPSGPIKLVVGFAAGGSTDVSARIVAQMLSRQLGQQVFVENKAGANSNVAAEYVSRAKPDGMTVFFNTSAVAINPSVYTKSDFNPMKVLKPVTQVLTAPLVVVVRPESNVRTLQDFYRYGKEQGSLFYGGSGTGNITQLTALRVAKEGSMQTTFVPYKTEPFAELMAGQIQFMAASVAAALPFVQSGRLKAVAVTSPNRMPTLPDVPTVSESLGRPFDANAWFGLMVPARTPDDTVNRLHAAVLAAIKSPEWTAQFMSQGGSPVVSTPDAYGRFMHEEYERFRQLIVEEKIQAE